MQTTDPTQGRRVELILRQVDSLPTLPAVATRLLSLTSSDDTHAQQVIEVVQSDPALTARILSMCRKADLGVCGEFLTIDRAVVLLGFNAIRNAALSVKVVEVFEKADGEATDTDPDLLRFDRTGFWRHSLAVGLAAEMIAEASGGDGDLVPDEAFVCGLLHDIGKLAIDHVLPKSFARIVELADLNQGNIAEFERRIAGLDHHTVGKRLAEQWRLPHRLQDCIWLHGSPFKSLPQLAHRRLIGLVTLADFVVRQQHLGYSGNFPLTDTLENLAGAIDIDPETVSGIIPGLYDTLAARSRMMGLDERPSRELFLNSIQQANQMLGQLNGGLERRTRTMERQGQILEAITAFHATAAPGRSVQDVLNEVAASARGVLGAGFYALINPHQTGSQNDRGWLVCQYGGATQPVHSELMDPPPHAPDLRELDPREPAALNLASIVPWISDFLIEAPDVREVRLMPLGCGGGTAAVLLHDRDDLSTWQQMAPLMSTWGTAIASASQHDGARRLGEDLAESNFALANAHDRLLHSESMARVGEMAAGAAHEMNNPLAVISGRSQLLSMTLPRGTKEHQAALTIVEQAHGLSDLITSLKLFAEPPQPKRVATDVAQLLHDALDRVRGTLSAEPNDVEVSVSVQNSLSTEPMDPEQIGRAVDEMLFNAWQSEPKSCIQIDARVDETGGAGGRLLIQVSDDGQGMDEHTLAHAKDPFFSAKRAGRRVGMGLARAQQLAAAHDGRIELRSALGKGTRATLAISLDGREVLPDSQNRQGDQDESPRRAEQLASDAGGNIDRFNTR